jgi:DNA repair photolyase
MFVEEYRIKMGESQRKRLQNPELIKKMSESRIKFHNDNPGFIKNVLSKWREENPEYYKETKIRQGKSLSKYYKNNPGLAREIQKRWREENPEKDIQVREILSNKLKKYWKKVNFFVKFFLFFLLY